MLTFSSNMKKNLKTSSLNLKPSGMYKESKYYD